MPSIKSETETVIKKILPYLSRRGYDIEVDFDFEPKAINVSKNTTGYVDILVTLGKNKPYFLIEAKKISKRLSEKDRDQAIAYANSQNINVPFVVITNGVDIQCFNSKNSKLILWNGKTSQKIPSKDQLSIAMRTLRADPDCTNISINDNFLPFRQGLPLRQLNNLFAKCHSTIRKIEKSEENAFSDFSKLLFLKLLEEKSDVDLSFTLPYSYRFYELATKPIHEADQVMSAILSMIGSITEKTPYGDVLRDAIKLKNPKTFLSIIKDLSSVSFYDCSLDSKGAAFEYFVRATLKGKKLGQYFTPRELVEVMLNLIGREKIANSAISNTKIKVLDPACGTGGFLVFLMQDAIVQLQEMLKNRKITQENFDNAVRKIKQDIFFGSDANEGVAASAKMNMIIAGDGHTNIQHEDSLSRNSKNWTVTKPDCNLILTNPPFGTSEAESLDFIDKAEYDIPSTKGQHLFIQKMIKSTLAGGEICTVIDEGVLNTDTAKDLRKWILKQCDLIAVVSLPEETFKPNKINVKSSVLYLRKKAVSNEDFDDRYNTIFCSIGSLGYDGSGVKLRDFDKEKFLQEVATKILSIKSKEVEKGYHWKAFSLDIAEVYGDRTFRLDFKYWNREVLDQINALNKQIGSVGISDINTIPTSRGKSPSMDSYVDRQDGFALVVKAGSTIDKFGNIILDDSDWIEKSLYNEMIETRGKDFPLKKWDILLSSTGEGTLGKCGVYDLNFPAIPDGHVTVIRVNTEVIDPYYLANYLRNGFGSIQISRLFTGSTGLIELTPEQVDCIVVNLTIPLNQQKLESTRIRKMEKMYIRKMHEAQLILSKIQSKGLNNISASSEEGNDEKENIIY